MSLDLIARQLKRETEAADLARKRMHDARREANSAATPQATSKAAKRSSSSRIRSQPQSRAATESCPRGRAGLDAASVVNHLKEADPHTLALITMKVCLDCLGKNPGHRSSNSPPPSARPCNWGSALLLRRGVSRPVQTGRPVLPPKHRLAPEGHRHQTHLQPRRHRVGTMGQRRESQGWPMATPGHERHNRMATRAVIAPVVAKNHHQNLLLPRVHRT